MNRRQFLQDTARLVNFAALAEVTRSVPGVPCPVTLLAMSDYGQDLSKEIAAVMAADGLRLKGKKVLLKPNFVEAHPQRPINTHVAVIANAAQACLRLGATEVIVGEASGHRRDPWFSVLNPSLKGILDKRVRCADLNHGDVVSIANNGRRTGLPDFHISRPVVEADVLISMPKMKTHHWMGVTLCLKNLFGILPGVYYGWPKNLLHFKGIGNSILDLAETIKIHYNIIDGVIGMEGDGPIMGKAKPVGVLVLSSCSLAADATAARIMGFDPRKVPYLFQADRFLQGLKQQDVVIRGERPGRFATRFDCLDDFKGMQGGSFF